MTDTIAELRERHLAMADKAIADDSDHLDAPGPNDMAWLIAQLACWPTRVDPSCTTNSRFLMVSAAHSLRSLLDRVEAGEWRPYIGQEVRATSHVIEKWPDWRDTRLWVVGISKDRVGNKYPVDGINVTVSDEWPVTSKTGGFTDGFYIGRQFDADDLEPAPAPQQKADTP